MGVHAVLGLLVRRPIDGRSVRKRVVAIVLRQGQGIRVIHHIVWRCENVLRIIGRHCLREKKKWDVRVAGVRNRDSVRILPHRNVSGRELENRCKDTR